MNIAVEVWWSVCASRLPCLPPPLFGGSWMCTVVSFTSDLSLWVAVCDTWVTYSSFESSGGLMGFQDIFLTRWNAESSLLDSWRLLSDAFSRAYFLLGFAASTSFKRFEFVLEECQDCCYLCVVPPRLPFYLCSAPFPRPSSGFFFSVPCLPVVDLKRFSHEPISW